MPISYLESERELDSSSLSMSLCEWTLGVGQWGKGMTMVGGAPVKWCSGSGGGKIETRLSGGESNQD
jgi:hypothetical protein